MFLSINMKFWWIVQLFAPFFHLVLPEPHHQLIPLYFCLFAFSLDFDANNIFRAFFGGHGGGGGGYSFDSSPGMFFSSFFPVWTSTSLLNHGKIYQRKCIILTNLFVCFFKTLDLEISFSNLAKVKDHIGKCSPAVDKIKMDPQSPPDAHTPECLTKSPHYSYSRGFSLVHSLLNLLLALMLTNSGKDNSET